MDIRNLAYVKGSISVKKDYKKIEGMIPKTVLDKKLPEFSFLTYDINIVDEAGNVAVDFFDKVDAIPAADCLHYLRKLSKLFLTYGYAFDCDVIYPETGDIFVTMTVMNDDYTEEDMKLITYHATYGAHDFKKRIRKNKCLEYYEFFMDEWNIIKGCSSKDLRELINNEETERMKKFNDINMIKEYAQVQLEYRDYIKALSEA